MVHPIRDVHVFCPPSTPVAWHPPEASHRWQWQESTRLGAEPKHLPRDHGWQWVGWHERWVAWVVCCCEVAFAPVAAHAWMDGWYHRWLGMDGCHGWQWVGGESYVQPVLFCKCDPLQRSLSALCKPPLPAHSDGLAAWFLKRLCEQSHVVTSDRVWKYTSLLSAACKTLNQPWWLFV